MAIPSTSSVAARLLRALARGQSLALPDLREPLADELELSAPDRSELVNWESKETKFGNRVGHARTLLVRLGLADQPSRGTTRITEAGLAVLGGDRAPRTGVNDATSAGLYRALDGDPDGRGLEPNEPVSRLDDWRETAAAEVADLDRAARPTTVRVAESPREPIPEPAAPLIPGPRALGRSIVLGAGDPIPSAWSGMPEIAVTDADLRKRTGTVDQLHREWAARQPLIIRLLGDAAALRRRATWTVPLWQLERRFDPWTDRLLFLVWNNSYDGRGGRTPRWYWTTLAVKAGAEATPQGPADVRLPGGEAAWVDGGPRRPFPDGAFGDQRVLHYLTVERGSSRASPAFSEPDAELAPDQLEAVRHVSGAARVIAPAGSGKTRVLTERLRHVLVDRRYTREQVVAVAYNKRAQREMVRRTKDFAPRVQTLNSLGWEILRDAMPRIQFVDDPQVREIFEKHCPPLDRRANTDPLAPYLQALNIARQSLLDPADVETSYSDIAGFGGAFRGYRTELLDRNLADYDEQLYRTCELLLGDADLRRRWQAQCRHLLVDEFQDLTPLHLLMIRTLGSPALDVFGTGDDDQVIYGYAGADPHFLIEFVDLFPGATAHALEVNYRCPTAVVTAASTLLTHNRVRVSKRIRAAREGGSSATFNVLAHSPEATAATIVAVVRDWVDGGSAPRDVAVLCRVNAGLLTPQIALHEEGIPCINAVSAEILKRTGVRSAMAYLRLALQPQAMRSRDLEEASRRPSRGFSRELMEEIRGRGTWATAELRALATGQSGRSAGRLFEFIDDLRDIARAAATGQTAVALAAIRQVGLEQAMRQLDAKSLGESHIDDLDALANLAALNPDVVKFEDWLRDLLAQPSDQNGVTLATVHKVKGEEWDRVLVIDVREGVLPHRRAEDIEEERRILHVAITRGREEVVVLTDRARPSMFIPQLHERWVEPPHAPPPRATQSARPIRAGGVTQPADRQHFRPVEQTVIPSEGMALEASGGHRGTVASIDGGGVYIATSSGGRLRIRYGERVTVNDEVRVLREQ